MAAGGGTATCGAGSVGGSVGASGSASVAVANLTFALGAAAGTTHCVNNGMPLFTFRDFTLMSVGSSSFTSSALAISTMKLKVRVTSDGICAKLGSFAEIYECPAHLVLRNMWRIEPAVFDGNLQAAEDGFKWGPCYCYLAAFCHICVPAPSFCRRIPVRRRVAFWRLFIWRNPGA